MMTKIELCCSLFLLVLSMQICTITAQADFNYTCTGSCNQLLPDVRGLGGTLLMGGGIDVDSAFVWFLGQANGGDVIILRTSGDGAYNDYLYTLGPKVNSVSTFVLTDTAGNDDYLLGRVGNASAIFWAGGDQWTYYSWFKNTALAVVIQAAIKQGTVYGGTSAGCAVQSEYIYTAEFDTIESPDALADPYNYQVTIGTNFPGSGFVSNVITDTHFEQRDRMGRLLAFLARLRTDAWTGVPLAIGINEQSAICILPNGQAFLRGGASTAAAFLVTLNAADLLICHPSRPLTLQANVYSVAVNSSIFYDFSTNLPVSTSNTLSYSLKVHRGQVSSSTGNVYGQ